MKLFTHDDYPYTTIELAKAAQAAHYMENYGCTGPIAEYDLIDPLYIYVGDHSFNPETLNGKSITIRIDGQPFTLTIGAEVECITVHGTDIRTITWVNYHYDGKQFTTEYLLAEGYSVELGRAGGWNIPALELVNTNPSRCTTRLL